VKARIRVEKAGRLERGWRRGELAAAAAPYRRIGTAAARLACLRMHLPRALRAQRNEVAPMDVKLGNSQIAQALAALKSPDAAKAVPASKPDFVASLDSALRSVSKTQQESNELQRQFQLENPAVSLEETMIAMNKSQLSFQAAVQVRNRLVQAYEQIMNMPV